MSASSSAPVKLSADGGQTAPASLRHYMRAEIARCDGSDPNLPVLIGYKGKVYDVTRSFPWAKGTHWRDIRAGHDLTQRLKESIYCEEMLERVACVGILVD
jgi:predicted heme/steroid binding protein